MVCRVSPLLSKQLLSYFECVSPFCADMNDDASSQLSELTSMGFSADIARHALMRYANNCERALDWLLNVGEEAAAAAAGVSFGGGGAAAAAPCMQSICPIFHRSAVVIGPNIFKGTPGGAAAAFSGGAAASGGRAAVATSTAIDTLQHDADDWMARLQVDQCCG